VDGAAEQPEGALTIAQQLIRKLDEESSRKMEHITAEEKAAKRCGLSHASGKAGRVEAALRMAADEQDPDKLMELMDRITELSLQIEVCTRNA
jgi:hypothetical protein